MEMQCRKAYVSVNLDVDEEGTIRPRFIRWRNGRIFEIDELRYKCRATSKKVGGGGIRYTVMIHGKEASHFRYGAGVPFTSERTPARSLPLLLARRHEHDGLQQGSWY